MVCTARPWLGSKSFGISDVVSSSRPHRQLLVVSAPIGSWPVFEVCLVLLKTIWFVLLLALPACLSLIFARQQLVALISSAVDSRARTPRDWVCC